MDEKLMDNLVKIFVKRGDARIIKNDGTEIVIDGYSLNICTDPIVGRTKDGENVSIKRSDIADAGVV